MLITFIVIKAIITLERVFQWNYGRRTQIKRKKMNELSEEIETRTVEKYLEKFDYKWGGERKEIERDARSKERVYFKIWNFRMFNIFKS